SAYIDSNNSLHIAVGSTTYNFALNNTISGSSIRLSFDGSGGTIVQLVPGLSINLFYDNSVNSAPDKDKFLSAMNSAVNWLENTFSNPVTLNINVGWGTAPNINPVSNGGANLLVSAPGISASGTYTYSDISSHLPIAPASVAVSEYTNKTFGLSIAQAQ